MTARRRNEVLEKVGQIGPEWRPKDPPEELLHIWRWYLELHRWRGVQNGKPRPIDWTAISAWQTATGRELGPFELDVFAMLENTFFSVSFGDDKPVAPDPKGVAETIKRSLRSRADTKSLRNIDLKPKKHG